MGICPLSFLVSLCSAPIFVRSSERATPWTHFSSEWGNIQYLCRFRLAVDKVCCCSQAPEEIYCKLLVCSRNRWLLLLGSVANKDAVRRLIRIINCFHFFRPFSVISVALAESSVAWKTLWYLAAHFLEERVSQGMSVIWGVARWAPPRAPPGTGVITARFLLDPNLLHCKCSYSACPFRGVPPPFDTPWP